MPVSIDRTTSSNTVFEVDPVNHIRLNTPPIPTYAHTATLSAFTDSVPDDYVLEILLAHPKLVDAALLPEKDPNLITGVVTIDDATFTALLSLVSGVSAMSRFNCRALVDTRSPQKCIHKGALDPMVPINKGRRRGNREEFQK